MTDENSGERVRLHRERKRLAVRDAGMPWLGLVGEEREQAIRDFYGYSRSDMSTQAERQARADRITGSVTAKEMLAEAQAIWDGQGEREGLVDEARVSLAELRAITGGKK